MSSKKRSKPSNEFLNEMKNYSTDQLTEMFTLAIEQQAAKGIISPRTAKYYMRNIRKWINYVLGREL